MSYDTPYHGAAGAPGSGAAAISSLPLRRQLAIGFKDMGSRSWSTAKNFGMVGLMFSGIECGIEGFRARNDLANGVAAGCLTGGILARNGGPTAVAGGCAAFAAFSAAFRTFVLHFLSHADSAPPTSLGSRCLLYESPREYLPRQKQHRTLIFRWRCRTCVLLELP